MTGLCFFDCNVLQDRDKFPSNNTKDVVVGLASPMLIVFGNVGKSSTLSAKSRFCVFKKD